VEEIGVCQLAWQVLLDAQDPNWRVTVLLDVSSAARSHTLTAYFQETNSVKLGANVLPGIGNDPNDRLSMRACLAHELAHAQRFAAGFARPFALPDRLLDEAETSIAAAFMTPLIASDKEELVEDARAHLSHWLMQKRYL